MSPISFQSAVRTRVRTVLESGEQNRHQLNRVAVRQGLFPSNGPEILGGVFPPGRVWKVKIGGGLCPGGDELNRTSITTDVI